MPYLHISLKNKEIQQFITCTYMIYSKLHFLQLLLQHRYGPWALTVTESTCYGIMTVIILEKT